MLPTFNTIPGIRLGRGTAEFQLDLFFDLQCPYSKASWDVIGEPITQKWGEYLNIYFHPICLSHHRQSWDLTRTLFAVRSLDESKTTDFIDLVYSEHEQFYNAQWKSKSQDELLDHLVRFAGSVIDDTDGRLRELIESDQIYANAKRSIHYASAKQVWSTPTFFVNHVPRSQLTSSSQLDDWDQLLTELQPIP
jgi:protein-disulfide isomerase